MALDALLAKLEGRAVTPVTADLTPDVTPKPASMLACTPVTPVTAENDGTAGKSPPGGSAPAQANDPEDEPLPDPRAEARRQRVLELLAAKPGIRYAVVVDNPDTDPVILALAIRGRATCELQIPRDRYDPFLLLDLIERHGATVH